ncbi:hypothetical protein [Rhizobium binae]|uniref:hypothetical protein n=1 Tax=Rhizobium binae TaxID=1138190 RepID=UPI001C83CDBE|nr:hypothetical protein [Rhizobium binae]MBX4967863.1 hypothetical protein [Rhizobium binae]
MVWLDQKGLLQNETNYLATLRHLYGNFSCVVSGYRLLQLVEGNYGRLAAAGSRLRTLKEPWRPHSLESVLQLTPGQAIACIDIDVMDKFPWRWLLECVEHMDLGEDDRVLIGSIREGLRIR